MVEINRYKEFSELSSFVLQGANQIERWQRDRKYKKLHVSDDQGNIDLFVDATTNCRFFGRLTFYPFLDKTKKRH